MTGYNCTDNNCDKENIWRMCIDILYDEKYQLFPVLFIV